MEGGRRGRRAGQGLLKTKTGACMPKKKVVVSSEHTQQPSRYRKSSSSFKRSFAQGRAEEKVRRGNLTCELARESILERQHDDSFGVRNVGGVSVVWILTNFFSFFLHQRKQCFDYSVGKNQPLSL
jgi:hypothetical protein